MFEVVVSLTIASHRVVYSGPDAAAAKVAVFDAIFAEFPGSGDPVVIHGEADKDHPGSFDFFAYREHGGNSIIVSLNAK